MLFTNLDVRGSMKTMFRSTPIVMEKMNKHLDVLFTLKFKPKASYVQKQFMYVFLQEILKRILRTSFD